MGCPSMIARLLIIIRAKIWSNEACRRTSMMYRMLMKTEQLAGRIALRRRWLDSGRLPWFDCVFTQTPTPRGRRAAGLASVSGRKKFEKKIFWGSGRTMGRAPAAGPLRNVEHGFIEHSHVAGLMKALEGLLEVGRSR